MACLSLSSVSAYNDTIYRLELRFLVQPFLVQPYTHTTHSVARVRVTDLNCLSETSRRVESVRSERSEYHDEDNELIEEICYYGT